MNGHATYECSCVVLGSTISDIMPPHLPLRPFVPVATAVILAIWVVGCSHEPTPEEIRATRAADSVRVATKVREHRIDSIENRFPRIGYRRTVIETTSMLDSIRRTFAKAPETLRNYRALTTVNRKDLHYFRVGDTLMMPDSIVDDLRGYSVFPQYYRDGDTIGKIVFISNKWQAYACYERGELVRFAAANTGEERKPTFPGRYAVNWKSRLRLSSLDSNWRLPFTVNFHQYAGSAFHQFDMPGRPVSHSCVRQFLTDAEWLFKWVKQGKLDTNRRPIPFTGTTVIILDLFDFTRRRGGAWWDISSNKDVVIALPKDAMHVEEALIPISQIPKDVRGALPDRKRYVDAEQILRDRGVIRESIDLRESINYNKLRQEKRKRAAHEAARKKTETEKTRPPASE